LIPGGDAYDHLIKASAADYDAIWSKYHQINQYDESIGDLDCVADVGSDGTIALDCSLHMNWVIDLNDDVEISISNVVASRAASITAWFVGDGTTRAVTWPVSVTWVSGDAPDIDGTDDARTVITLLTFDGGTTWLGSAWAEGV
jgi:hypothetical protein